MFNYAQWIRIPQGDTYFMTQVEPKFIAELATGLGFRKLNATIDVYYNLLWYLNIARDPYKTGLTDSEITYISRLNTNKLVNILGPNYRGPHDQVDQRHCRISLIH